MIGIVCIDDCGGMMFNNRRQSMDSKLREDVYRTVGNGKLWMSNYSKGQFGDEFENIVVDDDFCNKAQVGDFCFIENPKDLKVRNIEQLIVYKWNRVYPADAKFDFDMSGMKLIGTSEFSGTSHERISKEEWK